MKIRDIYVLSWGIIGFICSSLFSLVFFSLTSLVLDDLLFKGSLWPLWTRITLPLCTFIVFLIVFFSFIKKGFNRGNLAEKNPVDDEIVVRKRANFIFIYACVALFIVANAAFFVVNEKVAERTEFFKSVKKIDSLGMQRFKDGFIIKVGVKGVTSDEYVMRIKLKAASYMKADIIDIEQKVPLKFKYQEFSFPIKFSDLSEKYHEVLVKRLPAIKDGANIQENILVDVSLHLKKSSRFSNSEIKVYGYIPDTKLALAKFAFECSERGCIIAQGQENNLDPDMK